MEPEITAPGPTVTAGPCARPAPPPARPPAARAEAGRHPRLLQDDQKIAAIRAPGQHGRHREIVIRPELLRTVRVAVILRPAAARPQIVCDRLGSPAQFARF